MTKSPNALVVRVFGYARTTPGNGPDDDGTKPIPGAQVTITEVATGAVTQQATGPDGRARFTCLAEGDYQLDVTASPTGYQKPSAPEFFREGRRFDSTASVPVPRGGEVLVHFGLTPVPAAIDGVVTIADPGGAGAAPTPVPGVAVEAWSGNRFVGSITTAATKKSSGSSAKPGEFSLGGIDQPGLIELRLTEQYTDAEGRTYVPAPGSASRFVWVPPGGPVTGVELEYVATMAEVDVGANVVEEVDGQRRKRALPDVTFRLFRLGDERPLRELTTQPHGASFRDLPAGDYRLVAVAPRGRGGQRLQMTRPAGTEVTLRVQDGQRIDLREEFEFAPVTGSVLGSVVVDTDSTPVPGVVVLVTSQQQPLVVERSVTDDDGEFFVSGLPAGVYRATLEQRVITAFGRRWELDPSDGDGDTGRTVVLRGRVTELVPPFRLVEEQHLILGQVFGPGGAGAPYVTVQVYPDGDPTSTPIASVLTDEQGSYQYRAPAAGTYYLRVLQTNGVAPQRTPVTVNSPATAPPLYVTTESPPPPPGGASPAAAATPPLQSRTTETEPVHPDDDFPFLTHEVDFDSRDGHGAAPGGGPAGGGVGRMVERQIRDVLGWRPRVADPKGFQAALQQAFTVREVQGHTEVEWKPRSYSVDIQADLGAITGAQASIYTRAKGAVEQVLPLLDGLTALRSDADDENVAAARAIVRSQLTELVRELGVEGGPRVRRVDQLFALLLRDGVGVETLREPEQVGGSLRLLRDRLGLQRERINTIDEERNFTNFLMIVDHVASLEASWVAQRDFFVRGSDKEPFLGTQLVLLARDLEVIAESVHEVEFAMDSVFLGPAERQTLELTFCCDEAGDLSESVRRVCDAPPLFVSELLSWVEQFAAEEGRHIIEEAGRQGVVVAFRPTLVLLEGLVRAALTTPNGGLQDSPPLPAAYGRQRVQRALGELADQLAAAVARVEQITEPVEDLAVGVAQRAQAQQNRPAVNR